jgi:hypothetical protein
MVSSNAFAIPAASLARLWRTSFLIYRSSNKILKFFRFTVKVKTKKEKGRVFHSSPLRRLVVTPEGHNLAPLVK